MSKLINLTYGTINSVFGSMELDYFMRLKGRGERFIIANDNEIEKDRIKQLMHEGK